MEKNGCINNSLTYYNIRFIFFFEILKLLFKSTHLFMSLIFGISSTVHSIQLYCLNNVISELYFIHFLKHFQFNCKLNFQLWILFVNNINMNEQYSSKLCRNFTFVAESIWILRLTKCLQCGSITNIYCGKISKTLRNFKCPQSFKQF